MAEMIFGCPHCGGAIQCDSQYAGQTVACPHCQGGIILPDEMPAAENTGPETLDRTPSPQDSSQGEASIATPETEPSQDPEPVTEPEPPVSEQAAVEAEESESPKPEVTPESIPGDSGQGTLTETEPAQEPVIDEHTTPAAEEKPEAATEPAPTPGPVAPKPKQPHLPKPGAKKMIRKGGGIVTRSTAGGTTGTFKPKSTIAPKSAPAQSDSTPSTAAVNPAETAKSDKEATGDIPAKAKGWSWAAFLWGPIWAIGNKVWWGLLTLLPAIGFIFHIILAVKGKQQAWQKGKWKDIDHFVRVQKRWVIVGLILFLLNIAAGVGLFIFGPGMAILKMKQEGFSGDIMIEDVSLEQISETPQLPEVSSEDNEIMPNESESLSSETESLPEPEADESEL